MTKVIRHVVSFMLLALLVAVLAITFAVFQRNSFDMGDVRADLPLLVMIWIAFAILAFAGFRLAIRPGRHA